MSLNTSLRFFINGGNYDEGEQEEKNKDFIKQLLEENEMFSEFVNDSLHKLTFLHGYFNSMIGLPVHSDGANEHNCVGVTVKDGGVEKTTIGILTDGYYIPHDLAFAVEAFVHDLYSNAKDVIEYSEED